MVPNFSNLINYHFFWNKVSLDFMSSAARGFNVGADRHAAERTGGKTGTQSPLGH